MLTGSLVEAFSGPRVERLKALVPVVPFAGIECLHEGLRVQDPEDDVHVAVRCLAGGAKGEREGFKRL